MTLGEFKAWLEGYEASFMDGAPNAEQYTKISDQLKKIMQPGDFNIPVQPFKPAIERNPNKWPDMPQPLKVWYSANDVRDVYLPNTCKEGNHHG